MCVCVCSMQQEVMKAAQEQRPPNLHPHLAAVELAMQRTTGVAAQLGSSTAIDVRMQPLMWLLLPTPPVVGLMQPHLWAFAGCQLSCIGTLSRLAWLDTAAGADAGAALPSSGSLVAGSFFRVFPDNAELQAGLAAMLAAQGEAINACAGGWVGVQGAAVGCRRALQWHLAPAAAVPTPVAFHVCLAAFLYYPAENLEQGRNPARVQRLRGRVAEATAAAVEARLAWVRTYFAQRQALLESGAAGKCCLMDMVYIAWLHAFMRGVDEVGMMGAGAGAPSSAAGWSAGRMRPRVSPPPAHHVITEHAPVAH